MKINYQIKLILFGLVLLLASCGSPVVKVDYKLQLAQAVAENNQQVAKALLSKVNLSANVRNLISQYFDVLGNKRVTLMRKLTISNPMVKNENHSFNEIHRAINLWTFADEVYRIEISKSVRILQREELFIGPSEVDFSKCKNFDSNKCAKKARQQLYQHIGSQELQDLLMKMAGKDPCINLTNNLIGQELADQCLQKRMGERQIDLIAIPKFSAQDWYQSF
jgi:hypothetical protein